METAELLNIISYIASLTFIFVAVGDIALLLTKNEAKGDRSLRLILAATMLIGAFLAYKREFATYFFWIVLGIGLVCQTILTWRKYSNYQKTLREYRKGKSR